jgi:hypothetical protein
MGRARWNILHFIHIKIVHAVYFENTSQITVKAKSSYC